MRNSQRISIVVVLGASLLGGVFSPRGVAAEGDAAPGAPAAAQLTPSEKAAVDQANKFVERGNEAVAKDSLPRAKAEYQHALRVFPRHLDALYNLGVVCERLGQTNEAVSAYQQYLGLRPDDADVWTQLGVLRDKSGDAAGARAAYGRALAANPNFGRAHHNLGVLLKEQGDLVEAQVHLEAFVKLEEQAGRQNGDADYSLGILYLALGRDHDAKLLLEKALDADPSVSYYNNAMGDVYLVQKRPDLSLDFYRKALEKDPKYAPAYSGEGDAYRDLNQRDKAVAAYQQALALRHDYALVHYKLGLLLADTDPAAARKHFENYLQSGKNLEFANQARANLEKLKTATVTPSTTKP